jgi:hypothetical protein
MSTAKIASMLSLSTAIVFFAILMATHLGGISQQYFEIVRSTEKYTEELLEHASQLNIILALDNAFIILYVSTAFFAIKTWATDAPRFVWITTYVLIALVGLLDFVENFHIYSMLQQVKAGAAITAHDIQWQSTESMLKWHLAYLGFFLMGFLIPANTTAEKMLKYSLWIFFVPTGILVYATIGTHLGMAFQWIRYLNLLSGFVMIYLIMRKNIK